MYAKLNAKIAKRTKLGSNKIQYKYKLFFMALPFVGLVFLFNYVPMFGWVYAFLDYKPGIPISQQAFVGLDNFALLFTQTSEFIKVMTNTLVLSFLGILTSPLPVILAIMLSQVTQKWLSKFVQTVTSIPNFLSWVLIYAIFFVLLSSEDGLVNKILLSTGLISEPSNLLGNEGIAWLFQTCVSLYKNMGWTAIIYIATLAGIDPELYDAAVVDGAGRFQKIIHITVPSIWPTFFVLLLLNIASILSAGGFEQYYIFQNPLVIDKIDVLDTYTYRMGLLQGQYSFATAVGVFKSLVSVLLLAFSGFISKCVRGHSII